MKEKIRIASGQGFWGDLLEAPVHQVTKGDIDYLVMDYLAEVTMSILQKQKNRNPNLGYARDLPDLMQRILPICKKKGIKVITNGGGVNPVHCADEMGKPELAIQAWLIISELPACPLPEQGHRIQAFLYSVR